MVVICNWCVLFVTSHFDVIFMFPNNVLAKFVDIICIFFYTHYHYFVCHCTKYKLSALQVRMSEENIINVTIHQLITAEISAARENRGVKHTHVEYKQSSIESVRLDMLAHKPVGKIESC